MSAVAITLPRPLSVLQKNGSNQGTWAVSGTYTFGSACHLEISDDGVTFTRIATLGSGTGAAWSGTYGPRAAGARKTLTVRFEEDHATSTTVTGVGIGIMVGVFGDSKATGANYSSYPGYTNPYGVAYKHATPSDFDWTDANDAGAADAIRQSAWIVYCDLVATQNACVVGFFYETHGGTDLGLTGPWDSTAFPLGGGGGGDFYFNIQQSVIALEGSDVSHILCDFGPNAPPSHFTRAYYKARCGESAAWHRANIGTLLPPTFWGIYGGTPEVLADQPYEDNIRGGILDIVADGSPSYMGAVNQTDTYADGTHPSTDAQRLAIARRWYLATKEFLAGTSITRGPRPSTITRSGTTVLITHDQTLGNADAAVLTTTPYKFTDSGSPVAVSSATKVSGAIVRLVIASVPAGTELLSFGREESMAGATVAMSTTNTLPDAGTIQRQAEPFFDVAVTLPPPTSGVSRTRLQLGM